MNAPFPTELTMLMVAEAGAGGEAVVGGEGVVGVDGGDAKSELLPPPPHPKASTQMTRERCFFMNCVFGKESTEWFSLG